MSSPTKQSSSPTVHQLDDFNRAMFACYAAYESYKPKFRNLARLALGTDEAFGAFDAERRELYDIAVDKAEEAVKTIYLTPRSCSSDDVNNEFYIDILNAIEANFIDTLQCGMYEIISLMFISDTQKRVWEQKFTQALLSMFDYICRIYKKSGCDYAVDSNFYIRDVSTLQDVPKHSYGSCSPGGTY